MKFLVIVREIYHGPVPDQAMELNRRIREWVQQQVAARVIESAYYMLPKAGMCVLDVESNEHLLSVLRQWPAYDYSGFEVHPLADLAHGIDDNYRRLERKSAEESKSRAGGPSQL